jgi:hypothetical protein
MMDAGQDLQMAINGWRYFARRNQDRTTVALGLFCQAIGPSLSLEAAAALYVREFIILGGSRMTPA